MSLKISRILHAGYVFECGNTQIAFDPIFENPFSLNCFAYPNVQFDIEKIKNLQFSAVFISHYHDDHCSFESLNLLNKQTSIYIYCIHEELLTMIQELGFKNIYSLKIDRPIQIGEIEVTPLLALDTDVDSIFHVKASGLNILNVVDSWIHPSTMKKLSGENWDFVLWPFQTMRELEVLSPKRADPPPCEMPHEWVEQLKTLRPKYIVPSSCQFIHEDWSWYNQALFPISYQLFEQQIKHILPNTQVVRMNPSIGFILDQNSTIQKTAALPWVLPIGKQDVDYHFNSQLEIPSTSEIAQRFPSLTEEATKNVFEFCSHGLLEKFNQLDEPSSQYFNQPRKWQLSLFDHRGKEITFRYIINKNSIHIDLLPEEAAQLNNIVASKLNNKIVRKQNNCQDEFFPAIPTASWSTEVPLFKLYNALKNGESLTSMYVRVNDMNFSNDIELQIKDVDILEDPLIRCLFNNNFGTYQKAQLDKIKSNHKNKRDKMKKELTLNPKLDLIFERHTNLSPEQIWKGWTHPETLKKWFCPRPWHVTDCRINLQAGGEFFTHMAGPNGEQSPNHGCFLEVIENEKLVWTNMMTEGFRPASIQNPGFPLVITLTISKTNKGTQYKAIVCHTDESGRSQHEQMGFQQGWGAAFNQLEEIFKNGK